MTDSHIPSPMGPGETDEFDLATLDETFAAAPDEDAPVPDGDYEVVVERVELKRSKASGSRMLEWEFRIIGPSCSGRKVWKYSLLETADQMAFLKRDLRKAGLALEKLSNLPSRLPELLDLRIEIRKQTRDEYENLYIRRRLEQGGEATSSVSRPF
jgi:hypothetical protein